MQSLAQDLPPSCTACSGQSGHMVCLPAADLEAPALQVRQESAAKLAAQAQEAAQREERVAALQARRQRPQSPPSPAVSTPPPADKVNDWHIPRSLLLALRAMFSHVCSCCTGGSLSQHWRQAVMALPRRPVDQHASLHIAQSRITALVLHKEAARRAADNMLATGSPTHGWLASLTVRCFQSDQVAVFSTHWRLSNVHLLPSGAQYVEACPGTDHVHLGMADVQVWGQQQAPHGMRLFSL